MPHLIRIPGIRGVTKQSASLLKVLANENRLLILCRLRAGDITVGELREFIGVSQSTLSQHLAYLRRHGLVRTRRVRQQVYYSVTEHPAQRLLEQLCDMHKH